MIKKSLFLFFFITILSCNDTEKNKIDVILENEVVNSGDNVVIKICIKRFKSKLFLPEYFLIRPNQNDTVRVGYDKKNKSCGGFKYGTKKIGFFKHHGFVKIPNDNEEIEICNFVIEYEVIE